MANAEHLAILKQGVEEWNAWRRANPEIRPLLARADLSGENLQGANLRRARLVHAVFTGAALAEADLLGADLTKAKLVETGLRRANLRWCLLGMADLSKADMTLADLTSANMTRARLRATYLGGATCLATNMTKADLRGANFGDALLRSAILRNASLAEASFRGARLSSTVLADLDLSTVKHLEAAEHFGPSTIGSDTLARTAEGVSSGDPASVAAVETFLRGAGLSDEAIDLFRLWAATPIQFFSTFISYTHTDKPFARRLHDQLQARGIRCWLDEKDLKPGDRILDVVDGAIRLHDKLLICCSRASLGDSWWVKDEIRKAQDRERKEERNIIIPLNLDGYLFEWQDGLASDLTSRLAADFTGWAQDNAKFEAEFERVVEALRA